MSQSPTSAQSLSENENYFQNWDALGLLIQRGSSFSGRERNCVYMNTGDARFTDVSAVSQLDFLDDGRAVGLSDWDQDGDVDMWLANRTAPRVRLIRNDLPGTNGYLALSLVGTTCNRDAIGARVEVYLNGSESRRLIETVRAGDGFLTQSSKWLHFGVGQNQPIATVRIRWPGEDDWEEIRDLETNARYRIVQGSRVASRLEKPEGITPLAATEHKIPPEPEHTRVVLTSRVALPVTDLVQLDGTRKSLRAGHTGPLLLNVWSSSCAPCLRELREFADDKAAFQSAGIRVVPVCTDRLGESTASDDMTTAMGILQELGLEENAGIASAADIAQLTSLQSWIFYRQRPLPLPCSFLLDANGDVAVIYRGATEPGQVLRDVRLLNATPELLAAEAFPGHGHFHFPKPGINPLALVKSYRDGGYLDDARKELMTALKQARSVNSSSSGPKAPKTNYLISLYRELASVEQALGNPTEATAAWQKAVQLDPNNLTLSVALAVALAQQGQPSQAREQLGRLANNAADDARTWRMLGQAYLTMGDYQIAIDHFSKGLENSPDDQTLRFDLGVGFQLQGDGKSAADRFEQILGQTPSHAHAANNLAWIYATDADETIRDGARAVHCASLACQLTKHQNPVFLGTLSAAYAEVGEFEKATKSIRQALQLAKGIGNDALSIDLERRLQLHAQRLPFRQGNN